ncbi:MAG: SpoVG family protein [Nitrosarchaeum sp.]|nr:SpoVG family protein [Nitrosarchaeum sp.]
MIEITDVQINFPVNADPANTKLKGFANIIFNDVFIVRNLRIIEGSQGFFVVMPNFRKKDGSFSDIAHPIKNDFRQLIEDKVLEAYEIALQKRKDKTHETNMHDS